MKEMNSVGIHTTGIKRDSPKGPDMQRGFACTAMCFHFKNKEEDHGGKLQAPIVITGVVPGEGGGERKTNSGKDP